MQAPAIRRALMLAATVVLTAAVTGILVRPSSSSTDAPRSVAEPMVALGAPQVVRVNLGTPAGEPSSPAPSAAEPADNSPTSEALDSKSNDRASPAAADAVAGHTPERPKGKRIKRRKSGKGGSEVDIFLDADDALARARELVRTGYVRLAIRSCRQALETNQGDARFHRVLGVAYTLVQNKRMACVAYRRYLRYAPRARDRDQVKRILEGC